MSTARIALVCSLPAVALSVLVLRMVRPDILGAYGQSLSASTWRLLELLATLGFLGTIAFVRLRSSRGRTSRRA
jgi:hypothetical protein